MKKAFGRRDRLPIVLALWGVLLLSQASWMVPHGWAQAVPRTAPAPAASGGHAAPAGQVSDDGDGDELLEHWGDPRYVREERRQMAGLLLLLGLTGLGSAWRRHTLRRMRFYA